ncbi:MAG: RibD family protein [Gemmatimonadota bacterium]
MRPYVICHMIPSVDGRIKMERWDLASFGVYDRIASTFHADAWMAGRVSMEVYGARQRPPLRRPSNPIPRADFVARVADSYGIAVDPSGKLNWKSADLHGDHAITVLTQTVSDGYLAFLRSKGVSYVFGGEKKLDLARVMEKLRELFGIRRLLLEGGGGINGSMLRAGLINELSILVAPVADGAVGTPTLFDVDDPPARATKLKLLSTKKLANGVVWLRYKVR